MEAGGRQSVFKVATIQKYLVGQKIINHAKKQESATNAQEQNQAIKEWRGLNIELTRQKTLKKLYKNV